MTHRLPPALAATALAALVSAGAIQAATPQKIVVGYQTGPDPIEVAIANGDLAKETGREIEFRRFDSGADIFAAIASGDVQIGDVGSSPFAAAASRGLDVKAVYITADAGNDEALVVRPGSRAGRPRARSSRPPPSRPTTTCCWRR